MHTALYLPTRHTCPSSIPVKQIYFVSEQSILMTQSVSFTEMQMHFYRDLEILLEPDGTTVTRELSAPWQVWEAALRTVGFQRNSSN